MDLENIWSKFAGIATFGLSVISTFIVAPPEYIISKTTFANWGFWVATVVAGLVSIATYFYKAKRYSGKWFKVAVLFFVLSIGTFFTYQHFRQTWTCSCYEDSLILIGSDAETLKNESVKNNPNDCKLWLQENQCKAERIWTKTSIDNNRLILGGIYTLLIPFLLITMMSMVQAYMLKKGSN